MLADVFSVLQWRDDQQDALDRAESGYTSLVSGQLGRELGQLEAANPELANGVLGLLTDADAVALRRIVLAPETCSRLLWDHPGACDDRDLWRYLTDALEVENARLADPPARPSSEGSTSTRWSALGDLRVDDAGAAVVSQPTLLGLVVDADSPAAVCFDYSTLHLGGMQLEHFHDAAAKDIAMRRIEAAMRGIVDTDAAVADFVRRFTLVANIVVDGESPKFTSGSTGQYIGRSIFCNAHLPSADVELLAESLVHEAVHSLLYMYEASHAWVLRKEPFSGDSVVESPWSGATLLVRPFLQACFVWFGLVHFWSLAQRGSAFRPQRLDERLATARRGFLAGPLLARIADYAPHIAPDVIELVRAMQEDVVSGARERSVSAPGAVS